MSGVEIFGAVAAAATLIELAKKCSARLKAIENTYREAAALLGRVDILVNTVKDVSNVLHEISQQRHYDGQIQVSKNEIVIWERMESVLHLCYKKLIDLDRRLGRMLAKGSGSKHQVLPPDIARLTDDIKTYIQTLTMLKGLFQLIFQQQNNLSQQSMHRDITDFRASQEDKMDEILGGINLINGRLRHHQLGQQSKHERSDSAAFDETPLSDSEDKIDSLSNHLNKIVLAATDVRASFAEPPTYSRYSQEAKGWRHSLAPSAITTNSERPTIDSGPNITHFEPLLELAKRFKQQAEYDLLYRHYEDAEFYQVEAIKSYEELHDAHSIPFDTYHDMQMDLAKIYQKLGKYDDAKSIFRRAAKRPLKYDGELGGRNIPLDTSQEANHRALLSHNMAELLLDEFESGAKSHTTDAESNEDEWVHLHEAESYAKRAFRIRRNIYGKSHESCKESAMLLIQIYSKSRSKRMYAETYSDLYLSDDVVQRNALPSFPSESNVSRARSLGTSDNSNLFEVVKNHNIPPQEVIPIMSSATSDELEQLEDGKSVIMIAMDCMNCNQCDRCDKIVDKILRLGVDRDAPFAYAVKKQRVNDCRYLLRHGANIDSMDTNNLTPLMHSVKQGNIDMVSFLLSSNADVNIRGGDKGQNALHIATNARDEHIFDLLLSCKSLDINAKDDHGLTALHQCAKQDNIDFAKSLYNAGADLEIRDRSARRRTPLWIATKEDKYQFAKTLLKWGASVDLGFLPQSKSRDIRNLLKKYHQQRINEGASSSRT